MGSNNRQLLGSPPHDGGLAGRRLSVCGCAAPEEAVLKALKKIKGITEVDTQTYTLMPL